MSDYKEIFAHCEHCPKLDKCEEALGEFIWLDDIPTPEDIGCEFFPRLGAALKEYVVERLYELFARDMEGNK